MKLENLKKLLNDKISEYNKILFWIREHENTMSSKRDILKNIEIIFEQAYRVQGLDESN